MKDNLNIDQQIELLHTYHLDLWAEIEAQLRVLRAAQEEIAELFTRTMCSFLHELSPRRRTPPHR